MMREKSYRKIIYDCAVCLAVVAAIAALVVFPKEAVAAAGNGLTLCANVIIPSLFPFFVLSSFVVGTGMTRHFGKLLEPLMRPLFGVSGGCVSAFALGFIGGYPVGAKTVISLYESGGCTKTEAERLLSFCNNSGPAFIFGVVGAGVFASSKIGLLLYLAHTLASVCVGILFRNWGGRGSSRISSSASGTSAPASGFTAAFTDAVKSSVASTVNICGFVVFFTVFIRMLFLSGFIPMLAGFVGNIFAPLGFDSAWAERLLTGIIELSSGVWSLKEAANHLTGSVAMAAFILGWAGLSVHFQVLSFIGTSGLSVRTYILGKFLQGVLSAGFVLIIAHLFFADIPASSLLADQVTSIAGTGFWRAALISCAGAVGVFLLFALCARRSNAKRLKRHGRFTSSRTK